MIYNKLAHMKEISAVIIAKNEADNIGDLIKNISWVKEIVVVNDFSSDQTADLAKALGAKVLNKKLVSFADQKNFGDSQATNNWVLSIDADERVDEDLRDEILSLPEDVGPAYTVVRKNMFLGKAMSSLDESLVRLYDRRHCRWVGEVHESVKVSGEPSQIRKGRLIHRSSPSMRIFLEKQNMYTDIETRKSMRLAKKSVFLGLTWLPAKTFLSSYIKRGCFRDGLYGFVWSLYTAIYKINIYSKELEKIDPRA